MKNDFFRSRVSRVNNKGYFGPPLAPPSERGEFNNSSPYEGEVGRGAVPYYPHTKSAYNRKYLNEN